MDLLDNVWGADQPCLPENTDWQLTVDTFKLEYDDDAGAENHLVMPSSDMQATAAFVMPVPTDPKGFEAIPSNAPGNCGFTTKFERRNVAPASRAETWIFSPPLDRLYVEMSTVFPIILQVDAEATIPADTVLRVALRFSKAEFKQEIVERCPRHCADDAAKHDPLLAHVLRSRNAAAQYGLDASRRPHILLPFSAPNGLCTELFTLECFSSCQGGIARRAVEILFTLEHNNLIIGSTSVDARSCACPSRDLRADEKRNVAPTAHTLSDWRKKPVTAPQAMPLNDSTLYSITVRGKEKFQLVRMIVEGLEEKSAAAKQQGDGVKQEDKAAAAAAGKGKRAAGAHTTAAAAAASVNTDVAMGGDTESEGEDEGVSSNNINTTAAAARQPAAGVTGALQPVPPREYSIVESGQTLGVAVAEWLRRMNMGQYEAAFKAMGYDDLDVLADLDEADLTTLGVRLPGHRRKLLLAAQKLSYVVPSARARLKRNNSSLAPTRSLSLCTRIYRSASQSGNLA
eukprot:m.115928 g.115928  ORF g.115928 m.115928 type:complete len:514 (+) comp16059_c1_seq2:620-2161(+)